MELRPVERGDVPEVVALVREVLGEFGLVFGEGCSTDDELASLPESYFGKGGAFWVAGRGRLIATCGVVPVAPATFELRKMYLRPEARGLGLGRVCLDKAVAFARAAGGRRLVLDTVEEMQRAIAFYEANGFVRDDAQIRSPRCTRGYAREL